MPPPPARPPAGVRALVCPTQAALSDLQRIKAAYAEDVPVEELVARGGAAAAARGSGMCVF